MHNHFPPRYPTAVMRRRHPIIVSLVALSLTLSAGFSPAFANGLIPTEKLATEVARSAPPVESVVAQRAAIETTLIGGGVEAGHAQARVAALTDAEVADLSRRIATAPAGGAWFLPFLLVAAVIGVLIGTRESQAGTRPATTNLFGHTIAHAP